jgi:hypothetical protein
VRLDCGQTAERIAGRTKETVAFVGAEERELVMSFDAVKLGTPVVELSSPTWCQQDGPPFPVARFRFDLLVGAAGIEGSKSSSSADENRTSARDGSTPIDARGSSSTLAVPKRWYEELAAALAAGDLPAAQRIAEQMRDGGTDAEAWPAPALKVLP